MAQGATLKRTGSEAGFDATVPSKQRKRYLHHHRLAWKQSLDGAASDEQHNHEVYEKQLLRAISLVFSQVGFDHAEPAALEAMRQLASEYMTKLLSCVRQSMLHSRRTQPIPHDFLSALNANNLTLSALLPHLDPPVEPERCQPALQVEPPSEEAGSREMKLVEQMMVDPSPNKPYIPSGLPALPSRHTYKAEAVYSNREVDPKKVRERATEEGRMGEEALRRLVSSRSRAVNNLESRVEKPTKSSKNRSRDMWKATMAFAINGGNASHSQQEDALEGLNEPALTEFDEYSIQVNADSIYWRKPAAKTPVTTTTDG